jgi:hypothetical protein
MIKTLILAILALMLNIAYSQDTIKIDIDTSFKIPYKGYVTSRFGIRWGTIHPGIDIGLKTGDPVVCAWSGEVIFARWGGGYGNLVVVRHPNGLETYYGHLSKIKAKEGQEIYAGDTLGLGGSTGYSTGPHLHFETRLYGEPINPEISIDFYSNKIRKQTIEVVLKYIPKHSDSVIDGEIQTIEMVAGSAMPTKSVIPKSLLEDKYVVVKRGDTPELIAKKNNINIERLCLINGIDKIQNMIPGDRIRIR